MRWMALCGVLLATGCVDIAEERAAAEDRIGRASVAALAVRVDDGLAAVRDLTADRVELWAQAPTLTVRLEGEAGRAVEVEVHNAISDAAMDGATLLASERPTVRRWRVVLESGETVRRIAPPDADDRSPWSAIVFADIQDRIDGVQDLYRSMRTEPDVRFGLISGDLTEQGSVSELRRFEREMETLPFPMYATLGNHELGHGSVEPPFHDRFGRGNFSFAYRGARFTLLDSASATIARRTYDRLAGWLADGKDSLHLAMMHIPPLDPSGLRNGAFASRAEAHKLLGMMARAGVDLTIYGHVHTFKPFKNVGIQAYISGGGGAIPQRFDGVGRHYLVVRVEPETPRFVVSVVPVSPAD